MKRVIKGFLYYYRSTANRLTINTIQCSADNCNNSATLWNTENEAFQCDQCYKPLCKLLQIKYSKRDESVEFFCDQHGCFQRMYCEDCKEPLCVYCQEWDHFNKKHVKKRIEYQNDYKNRLEQYIAKVNDMMSTLVIRHAETNSFISTSSSKIEDKVQELANDLKNSLNKAVNTCKEEYLERFRNSTKGLLAENTNALKVCQDIHKSGEVLLQCPQSIELFCKTPGLGLKIAQFDKSYLLDANSLNADVESTFDLDSGEKHIRTIDRFIRQCFGVISVKRNNICGSRISPGINVVVLVVDTDVIVDI